MKWQALEEVEGQSETQHQTPTIKHERKISGGLSSRHIYACVCNVYGRVHIWGCECLYFFVMVCRKECCLRCNKRLSFLIVRFLRSPFDAFIFCSNKRKCKLKCKLRLNSLFFWHGPLFGSWFCWFPSTSILLLCDAFYGACFLSEHLQQNDLFNKALN